jgi:hypothetical protein
MQQHSTYFTDSKRGPSGEVTKLAKPTGQEPARRYGIPTAAG